MQKAINVVGCITMCTVLVFTLFVVMMGFLPVVTMMCTSEFAVMYAVCALTAGFLLVNISQLKEGDYENCEVA